MGSYQELVNHSKVILNAENYGFWKARMRSLIRGIDPLVWKLVLVKWEEPKQKNDSGADEPKPEEDWSEDKTKKFKYNSKALTAIHCSISAETFNLIQGCETAKEAWDILHIQFEGTTKVQNSKKDMLASLFENLKMEEHETIADFSSKLSSLTQEAATLGKHYKDKKLVKKFLRCLPSKFMGYKSVQSVNQDTESLSFGEIVGMLQSHEMELNGEKKQKGLALSSVLETKSSEEEKCEDALGLLVKRFDKALRRAEKTYDQKKVVPARRTKESSERRGDVQCYKCKGVGHFKTECPTLKRREIQCFGCKGFGHTQLECVNDQNRRKERSMLAEEDTRDDSSEGTVEEVNNFVSFIGIAEFDENMAVTDAESEVGADDELKNADLKKENLLLEEKVEELQRELEAAQKLSKESVALIKDKLNLAKKAEQLEHDLSQDKGISNNLMGELIEQRKKIHMFAGTKQLDQILSYGRRSDVRRGLGYNVRTMVETGTTKFWKQVRKLKELGRFTWNGFRNQIWARKGDLRQATPRQSQRGVPTQSTNPGLGFKCNMALVTEDDDQSATWYFDSGCSRHMTGTKGFLQSLKKIRGGKVTFGDGSIGAIQGKGRTREIGQPQLANVYLVHGLQANLISISQLCDEGLTVVFTKRDCRAVDDVGKVILQGIRSGNNCYMWNSSCKEEKCFTACDDLHLWHQRLGHMNVRSLANLVDKEIVRGVPRVKGVDKSVCGPCTQGKQVKIQHKRVPDVQSKAVLNLVHMDLMGPVQTESLGGKRYVFVLVDDFSQYTWVRFLREKTKTAESFRILALCYILNDKDYLGKFDSRSDEGIFLGYSGNSTAFRVFNIRSKVLIESVNVVFDDYACTKWEGTVTGSDSDKEEEDRSAAHAEEGDQAAVIPPSEVQQVHRNHSPSDLIGDVNEGRRTRGV
ncbi:uncharacterized protein LOC112085206 [Eutrema salsugineum]|uniref:uncharacterized protein LOC112085206 n=1 Tax=Eutrema salsugineum TaxID=72664 RepID=UPI000CED79A8|nr:uncharacterized protein LOC112085206 [Eutrema salsugineum]